MITASVVRIIPCKFQNLILILLTVVNFMKLQQKFLYSWNLIQNYGIADLVHVT